MRKILYKVVVITNLLLVTFSCSKDDEVEPPIIDTWTKYLDEEEIPFTNRYGMVSFVIHNNVYLGGGTVGPSSRNAQADFYSLDLTSKKFTQIDSFPEGTLNWASAFSIGNFGYIVPGTINAVRSRIVYKFNGETKEWSRITDFPGEERTWGTSIVCNNKAYFGLGNASSGLMNDFWEFDPGTEKWKLLAPFPGEPRHSASEFSIGKYIYVGGGTTEELFRLNDFWRYEPDRNIWMRVASLPMGLGSSSSGSVNNFGYVIGGYGNDISEESVFFNLPSTTVSKVYRYDLKQDAWFKMEDFPEMPRVSALSFVANGKIFFGSSGFLTMDDNGEYNTWLNDNDLYYYTP